MSKRPSLKINAVSNWISLAVQVVVGFFLTPFIIAYLGKSGYGIWTLVGSFIGYYGLLNLGVGSAITRYIAHYSAINDLEHLNETANTAFLMFCVTGSIAILASFFLAEPLAHFFKVRLVHYSEFKQIIWILGCATGISFPCGVFSSILTAYERYVLVNIINISANLLRAGLTVIILRAGHGLAGIAYPTFVAALISIVALMILTRRFVPEFKFQLKAANLKTLKMLLVYGSITSILVAMDILRFQIDSIVIAKMVGMAEVGIYGVAALLVKYMLKTVSAGMGVLTPRFTTIYSLNNNDELKCKFLNSLSIASFITCGISLIGIIFGRSFILLWVGNEYVTAVPVLYILIVAWSFDLSQNPGIGLMYAINKHHYYAIATIIEALANVLLSILLVTRYGIVGVAMGTAIPMVTIKLFIQPIYVSRIINLKLSEYLKAIFPAFVVSAAILGAFGIIFCVYNLKLDGESLHVLVPCIALTCIIYFLANLIFLTTLRRMLVQSILKVGVLKT